MAEGERLRRSTWIRLRERPDLALLAAVVLVGLGLRLYRLGSFPDTLLADEADNAQAAVRILYHQPPPNGFFGLDWTQQPAYSIYLLSGFIGLFGFNIAAIRLPSALLSTLSLFPFYFLLRRQFSAAAALLTTFLLATNVWYMNFSRSGWNCSHTSFYMLMAMMFLTLALARLGDHSQPRWRRQLFFGLTGLFCALGLYSYPSGRAIGLGLFVFLPVALFCYRKHWRELVLGYTLMGAVTAALFAPQAAYVIRHWELFNGRTRTVALVQSPAYKADPVSTLRQQIQRNVLGPWDGRVNNTAQYTPVHEPQLERITGWLSLSGLLLSITAPALRRRPETWLWWTMLMSAWVPTQLLTVATPNGARGVIYVPALLYFVAAALEMVLGAVHRLRMRFGGSPVVDRLAIGVVAGVVLLAGSASVHHYWSWQSNPRTRQDRWAYVEASDFPAWAAWIVAAADSKRGVTNLDQWQAVHPARNPSVPAAAVSPSVPARATPGAQ